MHNPHRQESGSILVSILVIMIFLTMTVMSLAVVSQTNITRATQRIYLLQAQYAAESGADAVVAYLNSSSGSYADSGTEKLLYTYAPNYRATYQATVTDDPLDANKKTVQSIGRVYQPATATTPRHTCGRARPWLLGLERTALLRARKSGLRSSGKGSPPGVASSGK